MDKEHEHIIDKLDELLDITHRIEKKDVEQDGEIKHIKEDIVELKPLKKQAAQLTGAIRLLVILGIGSVSGVVVKLFFL